jgi:predicted RNase H-like nuclease (RuvC/YqgF family)
MKRQAPSSGADPKYADIPPLEKRSKTTDDDERIVPPQLMLMPPPQQNEIPKPSAGLQITATLPLSTFEVLHHIKASLASVDSDKAELKKNAQTMAVHEQQIAAHLVTISQQQQDIDNYKQTLESESKQKQKNTDSVNALIDSVNALVKKVAAQNAYNNYLLKRLDDYESTIKKLEEGAQRLEKRYQQGLRTAQARKASNKAMADAVKNEVFQCKDLLESMSSRLYLA